MSEKLKVNGRSDLVRDPHSRALINTDIDAYNAAKKRRSMIIEKNQEIADLKNNKHIDSNVSEDSNPITPRSDFKPPEYVFANIFNDLYDLFE